MNNKLPVSILASFTTLKELSNSKKYNTSYQLLSEFISYIINTNSIFTYTAVQMKQLLFTTFGFDIPEAVIKTASAPKYLPYVVKENSSFNVDKSQIPKNMIFEQTKIDAESKSTDIVESLIAYIERKEPDREIDKEALMQDFISFLIDDPNNTGKYNNYISEYILKNEKNKKIQKGLNDIREGSILYIGINYNINETGSIKKPLTLYLDTEVLFNLTGLNGEIYKVLTDDFYSQVINANLKDKKIKLRYFSDVKKQVDDFFASAERIVEGSSQFIEKAAMKNIVNGCESVSDVKVKKADFYHELRIKGILEDEHNDYYSEKNNEYNLENSNYTDPQDQESWKFISHINKLRKGVASQDDIDSEYLLITNTNSILKISRDQSEKIKEEKNVENISNFAISVDRITNLLWYKLGNGFGRKEKYPNNVNSVLKAKTILSSIISSNVSRTYKETVDKFKNGEITEEQLSSRIITLREKPILPEELFGEEIENNMDFSAEALSRFEEEVKSNRKTLNQKEQEISEKNQVIRQQREENQKLESELAAYHEKDLKKKKRRRNLLFSLCIFWKVFVLLAIIGIAVLFDKVFQSNIPLYVFGAADLIGLGGAIVSIIKKDVKKYFPKEKK